MVSAPAAGRGGRRKAKATAVARPEPEQGLECPRCHSDKTKFCYYNNYNVLQPRYFCRSCQRYWTVDGALRNVPVGGGCRNRNKRPSSSRDKLAVTPAAQPASTLAATSSMSMSMATFPNFISPPPGIGELPMATDLMLPSSNPEASSSSFLDVLRSGEGFLDAGMLHNQNNAGYFAGAGIGMAMPLPPPPPLPFDIGGTPMMQPTTAFQGGEQLGGGSSSVGAMPLPAMSTMGLNWQLQPNGVNGGTHQLDLGAVRNGVTAVMDISNTTNGGEGSSRDNNNNSSLM